MFSPPGFPYRPGRAGRFLAGLAILIAAGMPRTGLADEVSALAQILTGSFSTGRQAKADSAYPEIRRYVTPIWAHRDDGPWLYVEEVAGGADAPSRQRIYQLRYSPSQGGVEVRQFVIPRPDSVVGAWKDPKLLKGIHPGQLTPIEGCAWILRRRTEWEFVGGTVGVECVDPAMRAEGDALSYSTVQVTVRPEATTLWEQGFDRAERQVAGPAKGGYRFDKVAIGSVPARKGP